MLKCEIKDSQATVTLEAQNKVELYSDVFVAIETIMYRLFTHQVDKKSLIKILKIVIKEVKQGFPKFKDFTKEMDEKEGE